MPIVIPPPVPFHGIVVDEDGKPVEGAELFLTGLPDEPKAFDRPAWKGRSDAQGRFVADSSKSWLEGVALWPSSESIVAYHSGSTVTEVKIGPRSKISPANPLRVVLRRAVAKGLPLRVLDPNGTPIAGAKILTRSFGTLFSSTPVELRDRLSVTTGTDGRANLAAFSPEDAANVTIETKEFGTQAMKLNPSAVGEQTLTLRSVGQLSGRVTVAPKPRFAMDFEALHVGRNSGRLEFDPPEKADGLIVHGMSLSGWSLGASSSSFKSITNADGRFEVPALAAGSLVFSSPEGRAHLIEDRSKRKQADVVAGKCTEVEIVMKYGVRIEGALRERKTERPIVGATVVLRSSGGSDRVRVRTNGAGTFEGFVLPGEVSISLGNAGPYVLAKGLEVKLTDAPQGFDHSMVGVVEVVHGINVRGVVFDERGIPAPGAEIRCRTTSGRIADFRWDGTRPVADAQGEFVLEGLAPGIPLEVMARLGEAATATPIVVTPGTTKNLSLTVSPANTVSLGGRVVDEYGKPIAGVEVRVTSRWKTSTGAEASESMYTIFGTSKVITDAEGRFRFPRSLLRHAQHQASASATGKWQEPQAWYASTTPSFFDLPLFPNAPPEQAKIRADVDAAWEALNKGDHGKAEALFEALLQRLGAENQRPALALVVAPGLTHALQEQGRFPDAERQAHLVLELREKALPPDHRERADIIETLAFVCMKQDKHDEAEALYRKALAIYERGSGLDHPAVGRVLKNLSYFLLGRERHAEAEPLLERSCGILETAFGPDSPELIEPLTNRGLALGRLKRFEEAEPVLRRAMALAEKTDGAGEPRTVDILLNLAYVLREKGQDAEANELEARPRRIHEE